MKKLIVSLLLAMPSVLFAQTPPIEPGVSHELAKWRAARYSDVRYKLNLTLEKMSPVLKGTIEIRVNVGARTPSSATPATEGETTPIILDWRKIKDFEERSTLSNIFVNGRPVSSTDSDGSHADGGVRVPDHLIFRDGVVAGENVIKLDFTSPILTSGSAITRYVDKEDGSEYIYSLFVPSDASTAFPVFDQPDLKARFKLDVQYPKDWLVVSNTQGPWELKPVNGTGPSFADSIVYEKDFPETKPISTYIFALAAGPFANFREDLKDFQVTKDNLPIDPIEKKKFLASLDIPKGQNPAFIYVRKSQAAKLKPHAAEVFRLNREAVNYFEQYFDYKFPFPKYDLVLIPEFPFGGMEHAGATFLRESSIIFPQEPTKNDLVSRATLIFHEAAHQWFGDTVTMRWFDDLWLKEGFATFTAYKAMEKIMPSANAWKVFYERIKQGAYQTDSTRGTTAIYQPIANLSAAKSAYGNIVYNKAPAFLRQAEFYLGEDKFQTAVRAFLKKHEYANAGWSDLVNEFTNAEIQSVTNPEFLNSAQYPAWKQSTIDGTKEWARNWVMRPGLPVVRYEAQRLTYRDVIGMSYDGLALTQSSNNGFRWRQRTQAISMVSVESQIPTNSVVGVQVDTSSVLVSDKNDRTHVQIPPKTFFFFPNYKDYGYGIFLLDEKSRDHVLKNIQNEKDPFLRSMMWGALWDSVREGELDPRVFVELVVKNLVQARTSVRAVQGSEVPEIDESTTALLLNRVGTAMNYYIDSGRGAALASGTLAAPVENLLIARMRNAETLGQRITYYRAFLNVAQSENGRKVLKEMLRSEPPPSGGGQKVGVGSTNWPPANAGGSDLPLKTKDRFDIVTRLLILNDPEAAKLLAHLEKTETSDDAKRYAYAAKAAIGTAENKAKYWNDFTGNKEVSESWIEAAFGPWNSIRHADLTLPYLQKALHELPNHKRTRKIFFVNGWLGAFIGGQRSEEALNIVNKFLADNPNLDNDLRLKILENVDLIERAVKIRVKYGKN